MAIGIEECVRKREVKEKYKCIPSFDETQGKFSPIALLGVYYRRNDGRDTAYTNGSKEDSIHSSWFFHIRTNKEEGTWK